MLGSRFTGDFFFQVRRSVTKNLNNFQQMLDPIQSVSVDLESLNDWLDDAERLIASHAHPDTDLETQYLNHQVADGNFIN